ncbi:FAD-dependent oxidoreductase [Burkholderia cepacia]|uniref:FAD-dependent oxidoreductase n=1 Tax=Burkholderia cepacia TaxID=292 RepID=UPI0015751626|nr:FAD-dependent oxidoreductase [Burkholderia cepacia]NTX21300.1 FAD-dependent oxidoreductase [Burkholderia cepacia]
MGCIKRVLVVGAGIAGCGVAIALRDRGIDVTLVEKQDQWRFQSSGIFVYGNGLESLCAVGVLPEIIDAGFVIEDGKNLYFDHEGTSIAETQYPSPQQGVPAILGIKRAEMHRVLANRLIEQCVEIRLSTVLRSIENTDTHVCVTFSDGSSDTFDLVIGADGIRSQVRTLIFGSIEPRYSGFGVWRSVHERPRDLTKKIMQMGVGKRLGILPISDDKLYMFGTVREPENPWYEKDSWASVMRSKFEEFSGPARRFLDELSEQSEVLYTAVEEIALPLPWHRGRTIVIGDAAHASTPFMGQGGAMAVTDAVLLAERISTCSDIEATLSAFGHSRFPMCKFVQDVSRDVGQAGAVEDAATCKARNEAMCNTAQAKVDSFYQRLRSFSIDTAMS